MQSLSSSSSSSSGSGGGSLSLLSLPCVLSSAPENVGNITSDMTDLWRPPRRVRRLLLPIKLTFLSLPLKKPRAPFSLASPIVLGGAARFLFAVTWSRHFVRDPHRCRGVKIHPRSIG